MNNRILTLLLIISALSVTALLARNGNLAWMALPFLIYLGLGIAQSPDARKLRLKAKRLAELDRGERMATIEVCVTLTNQGTTIDRLSLSDPLLPGMILTEGAKLTQEAALEAGEETLFRYTFQAERGHFNWESVRVVVSDPFGLIETGLDIPAEAEVEVQPDLNRYRPFPLRQQRTRHWPGSIPARLGGSGTDFWGVREYHPGDSLRRLDWRKMARHRGQFFTKEFEQEEIVDIGLILDARLKTDMRIGDESLFEHSARATASLAEVFLRQGNRVSLLIFGEPRINVFPGYGKVQLNRILRTLAQVTPQPASGFDSLQQVPIQMFSSHSLILIVSPLAANDWMLFPRLRAYGYQLLLISPDPIDYVRHLLEKDAVTQLSSRLAGLERRLEIAKIAKLWVPVIDWKVSQPLSPLVRNILSQPHILRQS